MKLTVTPLDDDNEIDIEVLESPSSITMWHDQRMELQIAFKNGVFVWRRENDKPWQFFPQH